MQHFKWDLIHNMDRLRISVPETSSVFLSQKVFLKVEKMSQTYKNKLKPKGMV